MLQQNSNLKSCSCHNVFRGLTSWHKAGFMKIKRRMNSKDFCKKIFQQKLKIIINFSCKPVLNPFYNLMHFSASSGKFFTNRPSDLPSPPSKNRTIAWFKSNPLIPYIISTMTFDENSLECQLLRKKRIKRRKKKPFELLLGNRGGHQHVKWSAFTSPRFINNVYDGFAAWFF